MKYGLVVYALLAATAVWGQARTPKVDAMEQAVLEFALSAEEIKELEGKPVRLILETGESAENGVLKKFATTKEGNRFRTLEVQFEGKGVRKFAADKLIGIEVEQRQLPLRPIPSQQAYVLENANIRREAVLKRIGEEDDLWKPQSGDEFAEAVKSQKALLDKTEAHFADRKLTRVETDHFLLITDVSPQLWRERLQLLEKTTEVLERTLHVVRKTPVCTGKIVLASFQTQAGLREFVTKVRGAPELTEGIVIQLDYDGDDDWNAIIEASEESDPTYLTYCFVRYVAWAYVDCFPTTVPLPGWISAATSDWIAGVVMPAEKRPAGVITLRRRESAAAVQAAGSLERFFDQENIYDDQWGIAGTMADLLVKSGPERYWFFVTEVKEGHPWEESLERIYGMTRKDLTSAYGKAIGLPNLK